MKTTTADDIIRDIIAEGADSLLSIKYALEDGQLLDKLFSDSDQAAIEDTHSLIVALLNL